MKKFSLLILAIVCFIIGTNAQIIHIPADHSTIQSGIDAASTGDTVIVAEGTYFENINFKGKAITVSSQFILDSDTSHISKTIIDGSKPANPDTASVVTMCSGEDTTSVLMGFTIMGGTGTYFTIQTSNLLKRRGGGGVFVKGCGGKITHNIIEKNIIENSMDAFPHLGGGVFAWVYNNHTVIIRRNIIRNNGVTGKDYVYGGGIITACGRIICEYNEIINNTIIGTYGSCGGGIYSEFFDMFDGVKYEGIIHEAIIRNNLISGNISNSVNLGNGGGGYCQFNSYDEDSILIYNNIISNNQTNTVGGGLYLGNVQVRFCNNTIIDNTAEVDANCIFLSPSTELAIYNNIMWNKKPNPASLNEIIIDLVYSDTAKLLLFNNIMMRSMRVDGDENQKKVTAFNNSYTEPIFQTGLYQLAENSPGIGWAVDSIQIDTTWYYAPAYDFYGNKRPDPVDKYADLGAIESAFSRPANANLSDIGLWDRKLWPEFNKDTLDFVLPVPDTTVVTPQLDVIPEDWEAEVDINNAVSIGSADLADRTTTITVTSYDGTTQKTYTVLFRYAHKDPTLSNLSISKGILVPDFQTDSLAYTVCLPRLETNTPLVTCETTDPYASVLIEYATNIQSPYWAFRTTTITVTAEDGINSLKYKIEHSIDKYPIPPEITLVSDTVILNENIEVTSTEEGYICLVPLGAERNLDSIMVHLIDSAYVRAGETAYIDTAICGKYLLYAIDNCLNISTDVTVVMICDGISENIAETIRLYPIPVDQTLYIETDKTVSSVELFNVIGVKVMDKSKPDGGIDMSKLEQGIYFVRIYTERGEVYTGKVIKR